MSTTPEKFVVSLWGAAAWQDERTAPLIPCHSRDKVPCIQSWKQYQTAPPTVAQIKTWIKQFPQANWAMMTGEVSGLVVLDMDDFDAATAWRQATMADEPHTVIAETSPNHWHYYLKWPGHTCSNFAKRIPGFDFRGDGGYVVIPGSVHPSGDKYQWLTGHDPGSVAVSECPDWLLGELFGDTHPTPLPDGGDVAVTISWAGHDIDIPMSEYEKWLIDALAAGVAQGGRNQTGFCIGMYFLDKLGVSSTDMATAIKQWNSRCHPPMSEKEVDKLVPAILKYYNSKKQQKKQQEEAKRPENRQRSITELSNFLGIDILDVYQVPDDEKTLNIVAQHNGRVATASHKTIGGYRAWASEFSKQTLMVPFLPDKVTNQFSNDFLRLLFGCARIKKVSQGASKEGQVKMALESLFDGEIAVNRDESLLLPDGRGGKYFQKFFEDSKVVFHYSELKKHLQEITSDRIFDKEITGILDILGYKQKTILIHGGRARAWM